MAATPNAKNQLIVFGRYPTVGRVKTRLIPALGPAGAAALQKRFTEQTLVETRRSAARTGARVIFCHDGGTRQQIDRWLNLDGGSARPQATGDLGRRMFVAISEAFRCGAKRVVLMGTDIPGLCADILNQALARLERHDLVLGPSTDGGYWLIGMSRPENLFDGIAWSLPTVLEKTVALAKQKAMRVSLLAPLNDVDTPEDLARWPGSGQWAAPYVSIVIPTLNEAPQIGDTIAATVAADAEIIVSDGGSSDRTLALAREFGVRVVTGGKGRAGQQNRGAAVARGRVLLFLHADTRLPRGYVNHVFETLMDRRTVLGAFRFATDARTSAMDWIAFWTNLRAGRLGLPYGDQALFMRRRDFDHAGGFPDVPIAEDLYLVRRLARRGRIALAPAAAVTSARRWQRLGIMRTTLINTMIAAGCLAGVDPHRLAPLYRPKRKTTNR